MAPSMQLAPVVAAEAPKEASQSQTVKGTPGHCLLIGHAALLATVQGLAKLDFGDFSKDFESNADSVSGLSGFIVRNHVVPAAN
eukprot:CAMPEP_0173415872 /NCGR_PEP_ID=MMETSP1356-20130122/85097_1 /TAXON_ID=77927 ORGANISM="Hemiselmis virescens, Strain PCC157" /NCGR_SAMPLE_ID=MMETSP1356 /ASSEMBLY_ACC=CAM_ASM_000847 /LENGTH=83 /DNA_ID=CAMNT_0014378155 /DNA_START=67 /DNA_END=318 /DNA_ORIENTATION=+